MKKTKRTFSDTLKTLSIENSEKLMAKARQANNLAKRLKGKNRQIAYSVKANSLCRLVKSLPNKINISKYKKSTLYCPSDKKQLQICALQG